MCNRNFGVTTLLILVFFVCVNSNPIIIRTGIAKSQGQHEDANLFDTAHHKGIANFEEDEGFNKGSERKHTASADSGHFGEEKGIMKDHLDRNNFNKEQFYQHGGGGISDFGNKVAHKKGHHKTGFQNSYHKDETGSNSSFFDDAEDEGDQYVYKTNKGTFGNMGQGRHLGGNLDNSHYLNVGANRGLYDNAGAYENDLGNRQNYHRNNYYDARENAGRRNLASDYGEGGRYQEERLLDKPHYAKPYIEPYHKPALHKKRITIYEDPRYIGRQYHHEPRYADDYIELDVRPGGRYDRRSPHYYY